MRSTYSEMNESSYVLETWWVGISEVRYQYYCGYFWLYDLAGTPFEDFVGTLFLKVWREFLLSLKRRVKCTKGGRSLPPSFGKRGLPPILKYRIYQPSFPSVFGMKIPRKYRRVHTKIPNRYNSSGLVFSCIVPPLSFGGNELTNFGTGPHNVNHGKSAMVQKISKKQQK